MALNSNNGLLTEQLTEGEQIQNVIRLRRQEDCLPITESAYLRKNPCGTIVTPEKLKWIVFLM